MRLLIAGLLAVVASGGIAAPDGPNQQCRDDAGPAWVDDVSHFAANTRYHTGSPACAQVDSTGACPSPLAAACATKGAKAAFLEGPVNCGGQGWYCRILPQSGWNDDKTDSNFNHCNITSRMSGYNDAEAPNEDGHCHGSDQDGVRVVGTELASARV